MAVPVQPYPGTPAGCSSHLLVAAVAPVATDRRRGGRGCRPRRWGCSREARNGVSPQRGTHHGTHTHTRILVPSILPTVPDTAAHRHRSLLALSLGPPVTAYPTRNNGCDLIGGGHSQSALISAMPATLRLLSSSMLRLVHAKAAHATTVPNHGASVWRKDGVQNTVLGVGPPRHSRLVDAESHEGLTGPGAVPTC